MIFIVLYWIFGIALAIWFAKVIEEADNDR